MTAANTQQSADVKKIGQDIKMLAMALAISADRPSPDTQKALEKASRDFKTAHAAQAEVVKATTQAQAAQAAQLEIDKFIREGRDIAGKLRGDYLPSDGAAANIDAKHKVSAGETLTRLVTRQPGMVESADKAIKTAKSCGKPQKVEPSSARNTAVLVTSMVNNLSDVDVVRNGASIALVGEQKMQQVVEEVCAKGLIRNGRLRYADIKDLVVNNPASWPVARAVKATRVAQQ